MTHTTKKGLGNLDRLGIGIRIARPALNIGIAALRRRQVDRFYHRQYRCEPVTTLRKWH